MTFSLYLVTSCPSFSGRGRGYIRTVGIGSFIVYFPSFPPDSLLFTILGGKFAFVPFLGSLALILLILLFKVLLVIADLYSIRNLLFSAVIRSFTIFSGKFRLFHYY